MPCRGQEVVVCHDYAHGILASRVCARRVDRASDRTDPVGEVRER